MSSASASEVVGTSQQTLRNHYSDHGEPGERIDKLTADAKGALTYIWKIQHEKEGLQKARSRAEHDEGEIMDIDAKLTKIEADIENKRKEIDEILKNVRELVHCFVAIQKKKDEITKIHRSFSGTRRLFVWTSKELNGKVIAASCALQPADPPHGSSKCVMDCGIAIKDGCLEALEVVFGELFNRHSSLHERYEQGEIQKEYEEAGEKFAKELIEKGAGRG